MRPNLYTALIALSVAFNPVMGQQSQLNGINSPNKNKELPAEASQDWYAKAVTGIQQLQDQFNAAPTEGNFKVANTANHLSFQINPTGYTVYGAPKTEDKTAWKVAFNLKGIGRKDLQWIPSTNYSINQNQNQLSYHFDQVQVEYVNSDEGLRQNFVVHKKMSGKGALNVSIALQGDLLASLPNEDQLAFYAPNDVNNVMLTYEDLKVWDAQHKELPASMHLSNGTLDITVDDSQAAYPITIDPVNKSAEWKTSADGLFGGLLSTLQIDGSLYGFSVSGVGDVNGDGFGDVAIGAPALVDIFSGSGSLASVGAVFVYYGSASGLSTTPAKRLQPNTAVAGALFGYSIDGGDVTGDGINDIIVGAPLDSYTTTVAGLLGGVSATVKAGKVYIYPGGSLADPNPNNFLEVKLQGTGLFSNGVAGLLASNVNVNALFGWSVATTGDLNGDNKADLVVGCPAYMGINLLSVKNGAAFVFYSNNLNTSTPVQLQLPSSSLLGLPLPLNLGGLLYGFSVDGLGDYNKDGYPDVIVGAPAGVDLSSLGGVLTGQVLGGSAYIYYGNGSGINSSIGAKLQASAGGLLGNAANLFGYTVKGARNGAGVQTGSLLVGAPLGGLVPGLLGLHIQTGNVHVFKAKSLSSGTTTTQTSNQVIESPRSSNILQVLNNLDLNLLFGAAIDNTFDMNCDGYGDLVIGEPLSSGATLAMLQANAVGGSAYVFLNDGTAGYMPMPVYTLNATNGTDFLSVNAISMFGHSVAGAPAIHGNGAVPRVLVGSPSGSLDFDNSILDLGSTIGTLLDFSIIDNGPGKSFMFHADLCTGEDILPLTLLEWKGAEENKNIELNWKTTNEVNVNYFEVQRSTDGIHFETLGMVFANDPGATTNKYQFTDNDPNMGLNYYRLNMVDKDKKQDYSNLISFRISDNVAAKIAISPNPATSMIRVLFNGVSNSAYRIELRNSVGQLVNTKSANVTRSGQSEYLMRSASMSPGIYFITVYDKNNSIHFSDRVIVQ